MTLALKPLSQLSLLAILAPLLLLTDCSCGDGIGDVGPDGVQVSGQDAGSGAGDCVTNDDCPFGQSCTDGTCVPSTAVEEEGGCWTDANCPQGEVCAVATGRCVSQAASPEPPPPTTDVCQSGETRICGTKVGTCSYGEESCAGGQWSGNCVGGIRPTSETCDGADNNCDGAVDNGYTLGQPCNDGVGACRQVGLTVCTADGLDTQCSATALDDSGLVELCADDPDDDCDGQEDEGFEDLGLACTVGLGACERTGEWICTTDQLSLACSAMPGVAAPAELCGNGIDDNCDGQEDEGFTQVGTTCTLGVPPCETEGVWACAPDGVGVVCELPPAANETCNGADDDMNGCIDEGFDVGQPCAAGIGACRNAGMKVCSPDGLSTQCNVTAGTPGPNELCGNGIDDNCDGATDDGFPDLGIPCSQGAGECMRLGSTVCTADGLDTECSATPASPQPEVCDNKDNDCNSVVDNGCDDDGDNYCDAAYSVVGSPTVCPLSSGSSNLDCNDVSAAINPGAMEICNDAFDQNCDGDNNDGCDDCDPLIDADFDGSNQCDDCNDNNGANYPGATELCDGQDNDCDDNIDEDFDGDNDNYTTCGTVLPAGGLDPAWVDCNDGDGTVHPFACELCGDANGTVACGALNDRGNNVDEDCDGYTDENCFPCNPDDTDGDGVAECDGDCAPDDGDISPLFPEVCDGKDTDCNINSVDNCGVGDPCQFGAEPADVPPDTCASRLICVESLGPSGAGTGDFSCTSYCNATNLGLGLGDGCQSDEICSLYLTPTANIHGCNPATDIGTGTVGDSCSKDENCRSGNCFRDMRFTGNVKYCSDSCGGDAYCAGGTTCQVSTTFQSGRCMRLASYQTRTLGDSCNGTNENFDCQSGSGACAEVSAGNKICTDVCCNNTGCASGYFCSFNGNTDPGVSGGVETAPVCWPQTGTHDRPPGAQCNANDQCQSGFCDVNLSVCVSPCCHDTSCVSGQLCQDTMIEVNGGSQTFARVCLSTTPADPLEPMP